MMAFFENTWHNNCIITFNVVSLYEMISFRFINLDDKDKFTTFEKKI